LIKRFKQEEQEIGRESGEDGGTMGERERKLSFLIFGVIASFIYLPQKFN